MRVLKYLAPVLIVLIVAVPGRAQGLKCEDKWTVNECVDKLVVTPAAILPPEVASPPTVDTTVATDNVKAAITEVAEKSQAGTDSGGSKSGSTITDLSPWLNMLGLLSDSDASDGTLAVDLNFLATRWRKENTKHDSQLKWVFDVSPELYEPLIAAIPEAVRDDRKKTLKDELGDTSDSELQFTYLFVTDKLGRDFRRHASQLSALTGGIMLNAPKANDQAFDKERIDFHRSLQMAVMARGIDTNKPVSTLSRADREAIETLINKSQAFSQAIRDRLNAIRFAMSKSGALKLAQLVEQQPQLTLSGSRRIRDELVGPESWSAKVTWEQSFVSLNDFYSATPACRGLTNQLALSNEEGGAFVTCATGLNDFVEKNARKIENEGRWKASVEYKQVDRWRFALPDDGISLDRPKHDRVIASLGIGRAIQRGGEKDRIDFEAAFDSNLDDDDAYKSRLVATLTYTRRFREMDIPFSIVYANKSEFLEGVDKQIGLHVGLKFRALDPEK